MEKRKKRLAGIVVVGCVAVGAAALYTNTSFFALPQSGEPLAPMIPIAKPAATEAAKPAAPAQMPTESPAPNSVMRDLFAPPAGYMAILDSQPKAPAAHSSGSERAFAGASLPVLTGVIQGNGARVAILRQGTLSRSYRVGQAAGAYRVIAIGAKSVTLEGPGGTTEIMMGK